MMGGSVPATKISIGIKCVKCGRDGQCVWERWQGAAVLVALSGGFYERVSKKSRSLKIELVCEGCGAIQPSPTPPNLAQHDAAAGGADADPYRA
jgi:hypothetical protein